jgi:hypothetical protein
MKSMPLPKRKVSLTLSADVLVLVDRDARRRNDTRSGVIEHWLRLAANAALADEVEEATAAYYLALRGDERAADEKLSQALSSASRRVSYDDVVRPRRRRRANP